MPTYTASAVLRSLPAEFRGTLVSGSASVLCAYTRTGRGSEPTEHGDQPEDSLAVWAVEADLGSIPATYAKVTVDGEEWKVLRTARVAGGMVRLELEQ